MNALTLLIFLFAGAALGALYFFLLHRSVMLHASRAPAIRVVPLHMVRLAAAVAAFWIIAQAGPVPLLLALLGFILARHAALRWMGTD